MANIAIVGFANSGKTTLFNRLTSSHQKTGNFAGVTVAAKNAQVTVADIKANLVDLPGVPSLYSAIESGKDIQTTQTYLKQNKVDCLINVVDATQLRRQLYLTSQLLELGIPVLVVLSKTDRKEAQTVDVEGLANALGCSITSSQGILNQGIANQATSEQGTRDRILSLAIEHAQQTGQQKRNISQLYQTDDEALLESLQSTSLLAVEQQACSNACNCAAGASQLAAVKKARFNAIDALLAKINLSAERGISLTERIDSYLLSVKFGIPVFLLMMYLLFMFAINVGSALIDFFDIMAGTVFVDYPQYWLATSGLPTWLTTMVEGLGMGIQTVMTFIPVVTCLFIGLSLLETSGYLARAAFVVDALMQRIGLPGKAFVPLIVGFGCTVPAVMAARILDSERERLTTIMMAPFMSCGARLPVYALFAAAFFPESGQNIVFLLYLIGIAAAIGTGLLLKATVLQGRAQHSVMELPLYEWPGLTALLKRVTQRVKSFITGAGKTIVIVVCVLNFFNSLGIDGEFGHQDTDNSVLSQSAQVITPLLAPMGVEEDNWQAGVGIITGIFAKEALVATFNSLYSSVETDTLSEPSLIAAWHESITTVSENLLGIEPKDPLGVEIGEITELNTAAAEQGVEVSTYLAMQQAFNGKLAAFSYLLFILLYTPCAAAMGAIKNETDSKWATFAALWSFTLAYLSATLVYQLGQMGNTPLMSSINIGLVALLFIGIYALLKRRGARVLTIPVRPL
ncbi:ferrous iron transport protein B [Thalassotalea euphylliae]|uniref:Ferrous iron transport protein B n=2 Tax=Thalassotalea euphylliae TaxID=1655234 RepID=A0A3E0TWU2_9GAMM|nr:ferrous iron transport protein B [Thalassotalea euphylliae]